MVTDPAVKKRRADQEPIPEVFIPWSSQLALYLETKINIVTNARTNCRVPPITDVVHRIL